MMDLESSLEFHDGLGERPLLNISQPEIEVDPRLARLERRAFPVLGNGRIAFPAKRNWFEEIKRLDPAGNKRSRGN